MTRRRLVTLGACLLAAVGLAVASIATGIAPVPADLVTAGHAGTGQLTGVDRVQRGGDGRAAGAAGQRPAATTGPARATKPPALDPRGAGTEEAGEQQAVTERVDYTGSPTATFAYPGADYVKVHFTRLLVRPGDYVTVGDPEGRQVYTYRSDPRLLQEPADSPSTESGPDGFWAMSVTGDTAVVQLHRTLPGPGLGKLGVDIDKVAHGFTSAEKSTRAHQRAVAQPESLCGNDDSRDAVCYQAQYPAEYHTSLAVARLLINGDTLCTAWRVGANDRLFTNNHCIASDSDAQNTEVWFNYQCSTCGGRDVTPIVKVPADRVLKTDHTLDYTLFTVSNFDAVKQFGYLSLDVKKPVAGEQVYIPQHPEGQPTKLAISSDSDAGGTCVISAAVVDGYGTGTDTAYRCDTEPGSSGSPVLERGTHKVIALHHFGGCPNNGVRIDLVYAQVKQLL
jgi:lysyl endopeptidase